MIQQVTDLVKDELERANEIQVSQDATDSVQRSARAPNLPNAAIGILFRVVERLLEEGKPAKALNVLRAHSATNDEALANIKGVCELRLGLAGDALRTFHALASHPGFVHLPAAARTAIVANLATALLTRNDVSKCLRVLKKADQQSITVQMLHGAIQRWRNSLTIWQNAKWWLGIDTNKPIEYLGPKGEIVDIAVIAAHLRVPEKPDPSLVIRENDSLADTEAFWVRGEYVEHVRQWFRVHKKHATEHHQPDGIAWASATLELFLERPHDMASRLRGWFASKDGDVEMWVPCGISVKRSGRKRNDVILVWPEDSPGSISEASLAARWPQHDQIRHLADGVFLVLGAKTS